VVIFGFSSVLKEKLNTDYSVIFDKYPRRSYIDISA